ncbi:DUF3099 domain-containing protein [Rothia uropygialis]|uniref:DUF3099 domain-containing protein n=1 Tax=Kocuria sp. 36 TaxID=1415402 RepID=UPI00101D65FF|nr:DUF3099 domain-containing protein [Kocuria sp. 36]
MARRGQPHVPQEEAEDLHTITEAQAPHSEGIDHRMKRYALQMGLRIVCLIIAVIFDGWIRWVAVVGVAVLPWVAVVLANGNDRAEVKDVSYVPGATPRELIPGRDYDKERESPSGDESDKPPRDRPVSEEAPIYEDEVIEGEYRPGHDSR